MVQGELKANLHSTMATKDIMMEWKLGFILSLGLIHGIRWCLSIKNGLLNFSEYHLDHFHAHYHAIHSLQWEPSNVVHQTWALASNYDVVDGWSFGITNLIYVGFLNFFQKERKSCVRFNLKWDSSYIACCGWPTRDKLQPKLWNTNFQKFEKSSQKLKKSMNYN